ncbi:hypothetical protein B0H14DRAFT_3770106 [Mycena olivaceomarginata]|nr:hypothetical protein B0H14DRAFT_3770106 [Mycena olivaceomarginata]
MSSSKVILVTGSNTGIGYELVHLLAAKGHTICCRAKIKKEKNLDVKFVQLDITDIASAEAAVATIKRAEGRLDVLVNNAVILNVSTDMASNGLMVGPNGFLHQAVAYNTSKAAANSYTIALAHELKEEGIKVNAATPGFTTTKLNGFAPGGKTAEQGAQMLVEWALLGKEGKTGLFVNDAGEFPW